ncbi:MAG: hypothetical protein GY927_03860 [bacterium]|nr:hypothetical protein [bacterium]
MNVPVTVFPVRAACLCTDTNTGARTMSGLKLYQVWSKEKFVQFIHVRFPQSAEYHLASLTGIPATTCKKHVYGETKPSADHLIAYLVLFGPSLLRAVMGENAPQWAAGLAEDEKRRELHIEAKKLIDQLAEYSG